MNRFFEASRLDMRAENRDGKTVLANVFFTAPYKIAKPFPEKDGGLRVLVMSASAGILEGDEHIVNIDVGQGARLVYNTQAYEKIHCMEHGGAFRQVNITIDSGGELIYFPFPAIPFKDSAFESRYDIQLRDNTSRLALVDIVTCGRKASDEVFLYRYYKNMIAITQRSELSFYDNTCYEPARFDMLSFGLLEGYTHIANIVLCNFAENAGLIDSIRAVIKNEERITGGISRGAKGYAVVKILGDTAEILMQTADRILAFI